MTIGHNIDLIILLQMAFHTSASPGSPALWLDTILLMYNGSRLYGNRYFLETWSNTCITATAT